MPSLGSRCPFSMPRWPAFGRQLLACLPLAGLPEPQQQVRSWGAVRSSTRALRSPPPGSPKPTLPSSGGRRALR
eukprot:6759356-Alexandrium_andersonii.AAC.1